MVALDVAQLCGVAAEQDQRLRNSPELKKVRIPH